MRKFPESSLKKQNPGRPILAIPEMGKKKEFPHEKEKTLRWRDGDEWSPDQQDHSISGFGMLGKERWANHKRGEESETIKKTVGGLGGTQRRYPIPGCSLIG